MILFVIWFCLWFDSVRDMILFVILFIIWFWFYFIPRANWPCSRHVPVRDIIMFVIWFGSWYTSVRDMLLVVIWFSSWYGSVSKSGSVRYCFGNKMILYVIWFCFWYDFVLMDSLHEMALFIICFCSRYACDIWLCSWYHSVRDLRSQANMGVNKGNKIKTVVIGKNDFLSKYSH